MKVPEAAGDKDFYFLPSQLVAVIAKQSTQLFIDCEDTTALVNDGDAVGSRFQEFAKIEQDNSGVFHGLLGCHERRGGCVGRLLPSGRP